MRGLAAAGVALSLLAGPALAAAPSASAFGRIPAVVQAAISPDGQHVAVLGGASDQRSISIATIDQPGLPILALGNVDAVGLRWADNQHLIARVAIWNSVGLRQAYRFERNIVVDLQAHAVARLLEHDVDSGWSLEQPVIATTATEPHRIMMVGLTESTGATGRMDTRLDRKGLDQPFVAGLYSVDPATGRGTLVERGNFDTVGWEVDREGQPRVRLQIDEKTSRFTVFGRAKGSSQYTPVWSGDYASRRYYFGYSAADDAIYLGDTGRLVRKRLADGVIEPIGHSVEGSPSLLTDQFRDAVVGIQSGGEKPTVEWLDPEIGAVHGMLSRALKTQWVELEGWSADRTRFVVRASAPNSPAVWYLFDKSRGELSPLGEEYPELKGVALGTTSWITYKARDGLEIPAYLTLPPPGSTGSAKPPLVVLPHGGPTARDHFDFDFLAQFLAVRGYAVLQPQFRGSWGFGKAFEDAGRGEWGGKMQTDLLDGVAFLATSGQIDAARVCIVGASYGGYAALAGAALHPESYRCAAAIAGVSDLGLLLAEEGRLYGSDSASLSELRHDLGDAPYGKLEAVSPAKQAAAVRAPILLIHGDKDTVVQLEQSLHMADALKAAGRPFQMVVLEGENHYLTMSATRTKTLEAVDAFLAKNLPVAP
ncbi:MAG: prolyl oligopeptidase family protein [Phenylobacterium sp.]|nr:prolyl oligopeptidase family protein [Phenylobacterium sp.]